MQISSRNDADIRRWSWDSALRLALYWAIFAAGVVLTITYAIRPAFHQSLNGIAYAAAIAFLLASLRIAEGAEIAVTMVLEHDDEQLATHPVRVDVAMVKMLRRRIDDFVTGRQFLVVFMVLSLGLACLLLERTVGAADITVGNPPRWLQFLLRQDVRDGYAFWFPVVAVLVNAQLPSKLAAQQRPIRYFSEYLTQRVILVSLLIGRILGLGPLVRRLGAVERPPEPSRLQLYQALAGFRDGVGFETADILIEIDPADGSLDYSARFLMKAYGARSGTKIPEEDQWNGEISQPVFTIEALPAHCGVPSVIGPTLGANGTSVKWDVALAAPLRLHDECLFEVRYSVGAGGANIGVGDRDFFEYECDKFPVNTLSLTVRLKKTGKIAFREASITVDASREDVVNAREVERVTRGITALKDGYRYEMQFPLLPAAYKFTWEVGRPV